MPISSKKGGAFFGFNAMSTALHLALFCILIGIASHVFNEWANGNPLVTPIFVGAATVMLAPMLLFTLLAASVGLASMVMSAVHSGTWSEAGRMGNIGTNLITWALTMLAAGFSIKALNNNVIQGPGQYRRELKTIAAFNIILMLMPLLHLLNLCAFRNPADTGMPATTTGAPPGTEVREPKYTGGHQERALAA